MVCATWLFPQEEHPAWFKLVQNDLSLRFKFVEQNGLPKCHAHDGDRGTRLRKLVPENVSQVV